MVRTSPSQGGNPGSTPGRVTKYVKQANCFACKNFVKAQAYFVSKQKTELGSRVFR